VNIIVARNLQTRCHLAGSQLLDWLCFS